MNDFFQINSSSSVPNFKRKPLNINRDIDNEADFDMVVECLSVPNYMRNINQIKKISNWVIRNTELFSKIHSYRLQDDALQNENEDNLIVAILCSSNIEVFQESQALYNIKDKPEKLYVILEGIVEMFVQPKQLHSLSSLIKSKEIGQGQQTGDIDLFSNSVRNSSALAKTKCTAISIKKNIFDAHILDFYQNQYTDIINFIFNLKIFDGISNKHLFIKSFYDAYSQQIKYSQGQIVFTEKDSPDYVYFILSGSFLIKRHINQEDLRYGDQNMRMSLSTNRFESNNQMKGEFELNINEQKSQKIQVNLFQLEKGDFFGEEDIIENNFNRTFQVLCSSINGGGELLQFNREVFENIFMKHFTIQQYFILNLPIKRKLMVDKIQQNSKILKKTIPKENQEQYLEYLNKDPKESKSFLLQTPLESINNFSSSKSLNVKIYPHLHYDKSIASLQNIPKNVDDLQEEKFQNDDLKGKFNSQKNQKNSISSQIGSMSDLLDYAQQSILMLNQNQYIVKSQEQQLNDPTQKDFDQFKTNGHKIGQYYLPTKKRISSNDLCCQIENQSDQKLKMQQAINSIKQKMSETFDFNMNSFMKNKIQMSKNVVLQQKKNNQKQFQANPQKLNSKTLKSDENQISSTKKKQKPTIIKSSSLNKKEDDAILQGEMSKQFQKNLKQICYKFGKQDFNSLKMSLKNHIKNKDFKKILNANIKNGQSFQINYNQNQDRSKGILHLSEKIQYVQDKMNQQTNQNHLLQNFQSDQSDFKQLKTSKSDQNISNYILTSADLFQTPQNFKNKNEQTYSYSKFQVLSEKNPRINQKFFGVFQSPKSSANYYKLRNYNSSDQIQKNDDNIEIQQENRFLRHQSQNINHQFDLSQEYQDLKAQRIQQIFGKNSQQGNLNTQQEETQSQINQSNQYISGPVQNQSSQIFNFRNNKFIEENEKSCNSPQSDLNTPSHKFFEIQTYSTGQKTESEQKVGFNQKVKRFRPYSSSTHQSPVLSQSQIYLGTLDISQNNYPLGYYQKTFYISNSEKQRPSSCLTVTQNNMSQNFIKLKNNKLNQSLGKQIQFREKKQMSALLNIKKQFQNQNKSFSPQNSSQKQQNNIKSAQNQLLMIHSHKKYEPKDQCNAETPKLSQFPQNNQLQDSQSEKNFQFSFQSNKQSQMQNKSKLAQNLNNQIGYFQQYIANTQQPNNIKYHFHRKVVSDVSKCNYNIHQHSKFFQQQQAQQQEQSFNGNSIINNQNNQYQIKSSYSQQPQEFQQENFQTNHSTQLFSDHNLQQKNGLSRQSSLKQTIETNKQDNISYPILLSPDIFYSAQQDKKINRIISFSSSQRSQQGASLDLKEDSQQKLKNSNQFKAEKPKEILEKQQQISQQQQNVLNKSTHQENKQDLKLDSLLKTNKQNLLENVKTNQLLEKEQQNQQIGQIHQENKNQQDLKEDSLKKASKNNIFINTDKTPKILEKQQQQINESEQNSLVVESQKELNQFQHYAIKEPQNQIDTSVKQIQNLKQSFDTQKKETNIESFEKVKEKTQTEQQLLTSNNEKQKKVNLTEKNQNLKQKKQQANIKIEIPENKNKNELELNIKAMQEDQKEKLCEEEIKLDFHPILECIKTNSYENQTPQFKKIKNVKFQGKRISLNNSPKNEKIERKKSIDLQNQEIQEQDNQVGTFSNLQKKESLILNSSSQLSKTNSNEQIFQSRQQSSTFIKDQNSSKKVNSHESLIETVNSQHISSIQDQSSVYYKSSFSDLNLKQKSLTKTQNKSIEQGNQQQENISHKNQGIKSQQNGSQLFKNTVINSSIPIISEELSFDQSFIVDQNQETLNKFKLNGSTNSNMSQFQNFVDSPSLVKFRNNSQFSTNNFNENISKHNNMDSPSLVRFRNTSLFSINNINDQTSKQSLLFGQNDQVYQAKSQKNQQSHEITHQEKSNSNKTNNITIQNNSNNNHNQKSQKSISAFYKI